MPVVFWICRDEEEERWLVVAEGNVYGEYLNEEAAVLDAIDLAKMLGAAATPPRSGIGGQRRGSTDRFLKHTIDREGSEDAVGAPPYRLAPLTTIGIT